MIRLTQNNLENYFRIADIETSWYEEPTNTFDFVSRDSNELLVTIGDSYTYGAQLHPNVRKKQVYGNKLSLKLNSDWLNLGLSGVSNFWITDRAEEFAELVEKLHYKKITVLLCFTGIGRQFNTTFDGYINYSKWFEENYKSKTDFPKLFEMLNNECVNRILFAYKNKSNVNLLFSTNFVEQLGFEQLTDDQVIRKPWYRLLIDTDVVTYHSSYYSRLDEAIQWVPKDLQSDFKLWIIDLIDTSEQRIKLLDSCKHFKYAHPLDYGHSVWADYVYEKIKC